MLPCHDRTMLVFSTFRGALAGARRGAPSRGLPWLGLLVLLLAAPAMGSEEALEVTGRPASAAFLTEVLGLAGAWDLAPGEEATWGGRTVRNLALPRLETCLLAFSDHPERVRRRGLLFQGGLMAFKPVRFQYYHEGGREEGPLLLSVRISNRGERPVRIHLVEGAGGPDPEYFPAGHRNNVAFLRRLVAFEGRVVRLDPGESRQVALHPLPYLHVVSGTLQMTVLEGGPVGYALFALDDPGEPAGFDLQSNPADVHARGVYPVADQILSRGWQVGPVPGHVAFGAVRQPNFLEGPELKGDYGVLYRLELDLANPSADARRVEILFNPRGGKATGTFMARGPDGQLLEWLVPDPIPAFELVPLAVVEVPPGGGRWTVWTIPEGASNYPVRLVLRQAAVP